MGKTKIKALKKPEKSKKALKEEYEHREKILKISLIVFVAVLCVAVIVGIVATLILNYEPPLDKTISVTSEDYKVDNAMMAYLLYDNYNYFASNYSDYLSAYGLDTSKPLKSQTSPDGSTTWFDYFLNQAKSNITEMIVMAQAAADSGVSLTDDDYSAIDSAIQSLTEVASEKGLSTDDYINTYYAPGVDTAAVRRCMEIQQLANVYYQSLMADLEFSDEDYTSYVEENPSKFNMCDYFSYELKSGLDDDATDDEIAAAMEQIKPVADDLLTYATDIDTFTGKLRELIRKNTSETITDEEIDEKIESMYKTGVYYTANDDFSTWAFADERVAGDSTVIEGKTSYTVYFLIKPSYIDETLTKTVSHILISTDEYETEDAAKAKADEVLAEWENGERTLDSFKALAEQYSNDPGSASGGGVYENIKSGSMVAEFNDWCFDSSRKAGDVEIIKTDYGYHIIYFIGDGEPSWRVTALSSMKSDSYSTTLSDFKNNYTINFDDEKLSKIPG